MIAPHIQQHLDMLRLKPRIKPTGNKTKRPVGGRTNPCAPKSKSKSK